DDVVRRVHDGGEQAAGLIVMAALEGAGSHVSALTVALFEGTLNDGNEIAGEIGLAAVGACADLCCLVRDDSWIVLADEDDVGAGGLATQDPGGVETVHAGHADAHEDEVGVGSASEFDGLLAVAGLTADFP